MSLNQTEYAYTTIREIFYPVIKKVIRALTGFNASSELVAALSATLKVIAKDPEFGRQENNACGMAPCLTDDLAYIIDSMPTTLEYYHEECYAWLLGMSVGARSCSVFNMTVEESLKNVVESADRVSKTTGKPLLLVSGVYVTTIPITSLHPSPATTSL